ncbi:hypothetical protein M434DRAFT_391601 [Hypoxylon sp. CO27-5]|nr:hypothetical protein M434DRAFT_391601 [Hypoxylon sp. CO27-5]
MEGMGSVCKVSFLGVVTSDNATRLGMSHCMFSSGTMLAKYIFKAVGAAESLALPLSSFPVWVTVSKT